MSQGNRAASEREKELRARIVEGSQNPDDYRALSQLLRDAGRERDAIAVVERALRLPMRDIQRAMLYADMAWMLYESREDQRACEIAGVALSLVGKPADNPEVLRTLGVSHATLASCCYPTDRAASERAAGRALEFLERLVTEYPDFADFVEGCLHAAGMHVLIRNYARAIALYEQAMQVDPAERNRLSCLFCMGNALSSQGRYADAEERLREALELVEGDKRLLPRIYVELGTVQLRTSRTAEALVSFEEALKALELNPALRRDPQFVSEIRWTLGNLYYDSRRYTDAASVLREGLPDFPPHLYCHTLITIGNCHFATGKYGAARECYEEVLASDRASGEEKLAAQGAIAGLPPLPPTRVH